ncbi:MAG: FHA domain-containing protein [Blastocatellia bacterium]|nr:FHA domain-containing protein [Blastocatellia bacterium]
MVDFTDTHMKEVELFLQAAVEKSSVLTEDDIDPRDIVYELSSQLKQHCYTFGEDVLCVPNIITISIPETKADRVEDLETIFNCQSFLKLMDSYFNEKRLHLFNPLRVEVQTVSKGNSRVMYRRAGLSLDWPGIEMSAEDVRVEIDYRKKSINKIYPPTPQISQIARLTALNAEVYQNRYLVAKPTVKIGRMRSIVDEKTGKLIRRNDFVFAHQEIPQETGNSVSRQHASIIYKDDNFLLFDHGSVNGTIIQRMKTKNQITVSPENISGVVLEDGDMMRLGSAWVSFEFVHTDEKSPQASYTGYALPSN